MASPALDDDLGLLQRVKDFTIEQFITELRVEAFTVAVLPRTAWLDVGGLGSNGCNPLADGLGDELRAIVGTDVPRDAAQDEQVGQHVDHIGGLELPVHPDRQAFAGELVDDVEHAILPSRYGCDPRQSRRTRHGCGCSGRSRMHDPSLSQSRPLFGCFCGTFSPSRRQIRSTRLSFTTQPASRSMAAIRR